MGTVSAGLGAHPRLESRAERGAEDLLCCEKNWAHGQVQVCNLSRKGWVCFVRTSRSTGEKVMFTAGLRKREFSAAPELKWQQTRRGHSKRPLPASPAQMGRRGQLGNRLKKGKIKIRTQSLGQQAKRKERVTKMDREKTPVPAGLPGAD